MREEGRKEGRGVGGGWGEREAGEKRKREGEGVIGKEGGEIGHKIENESYRHTTTER